MAIKTMTVKKDCLCLLILYLYAFKQITIPRYFFYYASTDDHEALTVHLFTEYKTLVTESKERMTITNRRREETHMNHKE